jgi:hypothetical protein
MFAEAFHSTIKDIHLALEVKTSFGNSTCAIGSSMKSGSQKPEFPLTTVIGIARKKRRRTCTLKSYKAKLERLCSVLRPK